MGAVGQNIFEIKEQEAKERQNLGVNLPKGQTGRASVKAQESLKLMGLNVGEKYLREAKKLKENIPAKMRESSFKASKLFNVGTTYIQQLELLVRR